MDPLSTLIGASGAQPDPHRGTESLVGRCPICDHAKSLIVSLAPERASVWCVMNHGACDADAIVDRLGLPTDVILERLASGGFELAHDRPLQASRTLLGVTLLTRADLATLPEPEPLIAETLDRRSIALLAGPPGTGKSFVALDWAASVATGAPWLGRTAEPGRVLYIVGEGAHGLHARLSAWEAHHGAEIETDRFVVLPAAIQVTRPADLRELADHVEREDFDLVVFDTLARMAVGVDENSAEGMGRLVDAFETVKRATPRGTVLVVHHTGKDGETVRGSSSLEGAMDTVYRIDATFEPHALKRTKRKDGPVEDVIDFRLQEVADSCVFVPTDRRSFATIEADPEAWHAGWTAVRLTFRGDADFSKSDAVRTMIASGIARTTAYRYLTELVAHGLVRNVMRSESAPPRYKVQDHVARRLRIAIPEPFALRLPDGADGVPLPSH
ncbi:MAG: AAA family ATPase [Frankiales bacterium]|nr:AAA family ATPase [Frankiales bacterium]